jgi:hypothetical protein
MSQPGVVLDFRTITDPSSLVQSLTVFRQAHEEIYVSVHNLKVSFESDPLDLLGGLVDLRDEDLTKRLAIAFDVNNLSLENWNLPLALRILQFAIREGYISVLDDPQWQQGVLVSSLPTEDPGRIEVHLPQAVEYLVSGDEERLEILPASCRNAFLKDVEFAASNDWQLVVGSTRLANWLSGNLSHAGLIAELKAGTVRDVFPYWMPSSVREIFDAIATPSLLPNIVNATTRLIEQQGYRKDLLWFIPRFLADLASAGIASQVEMLYRICSHNWDRKGQKTEKRKNI